MATLRQVEANRRNAQSSSGPKTEAGRAAAAKNSLQHGLLSEEAILPGESASDYAGFAEKLHMEMQPIGELESALVGRIGGLLWRLKRVGRLEAGILLYEHAELKSYSSETIQEVYVFGADYIARQGEVYSRGADSFAKLSRYETSLERSLYKALHEFQRLQAARNGEHVPAPVAVDVTVTEGI